MGRAGESEPGEYLDLGGLMGGLAGVAGGGKLGIDLTSLHSSGVLNEPSIDSDRDQALAVWTAFSFPTPNQSSARGSNGLAASRAKFSHDGSLPFIRCMWPLAQDPSQSAMFLYFFSRRFISGFQSKLKVGQMSCHTA